MYLKNSDQGALMLNPNHSDIQSAIEFYNADNWLAENAPQFLDNHNGE